MTGFSVGGRVVDGTGMGVDGVKIVVDGEERSVTDKEGNYKLDQVISFCHFLAEMLHSGLIFRFRGKDHCLFL